MRVENFRWNIHHNLKDEILYFIKGSPFVCWTGSKAHSQHYYEMQLQTHTQCGTKKSSHTNWHTHFIRVFNKIFPYAHATFKLCKCILVAALRCWLMLLLVGSMMLIPFRRRRIMIVSVAVRRIVTIFAWLRATAWRAFYGTIVKGLARIKSQAIFVVWLGWHDTFVGFITGSYFTLYTISRSFAMIMAHKNIFYSNNTQLNPQVIITHFLLLSSYFFPYTHKY